MNRFKEGSTWAGMAAIMQMAKAFVPPQYHIYLDGATAVAGALAGAIPDKSTVATA